MSEDFRPIPEFHQSKHRVESVFHYIIDVGLLFDEYSQKNSSDFRDNAGDTVAEPGDSYTDIEVSTQCGFRKKYHLSNPKTEAEISALRNKWYFLAIHNGYSYLMICNSQYPDVQDSYLFD